MDDSCELGRLKSAAAFDRKTLEAIYHDFHDQLYRYVYRQVNDIDVSRDLVADVFCKFLQALQRGKGPKHHLKAWLYRVAHNAVVDYYRQRERTHVALDEEYLPGEGDVRRVVDNHLTAAEVRSALNLLTLEQRQVITLKLLAGLDNSEVAEILGKPVGAVKSLQHRALVSLRRHLVAEQERTL